MRWRSLPQPSQCLSASARSCTIRSRTRFFARGCRPVRFLTGASGGFSSPSVSAAAGSSLASSGCRVFQSSSNSFSCSFESSSNSFSCSFESSSNSFSCSFGSVLGSMGGTCLQNNRDLLRFQAKSNYDQNVLCVCAPIPLAPRSVAQIDAAQQRSEFFHADLKTPGARLSAGNRVGTRFQTFRPDGKPIPVSSRPREFHPEPLTEPCINLSIYTALVIQPGSRMPASGRTTPDRPPSSWRAIPGCAAYAATASCTCVWPTARACDRYIERALASQFDRRFRSIPTTRVSPSCIAAPVRPTSPASGVECASLAPPSVCASLHQSSHPAGN